MKFVVILVAAIVIVAGVFYAMDGADGPAENAGAAIDEAVSDASRAVEDASD